LGLFKVLIFLNIYEWTNQQPKTVNQKPITVNRQQTTDNR